MALTIEKNIPIPVRVNGRPPKYPWDQMEIGDSFFSPGGKARRAAYWAGQKYGKKFAFGREEGGYRIWRVE